MFILALFFSCTMKLRSRGRNPAKMYVNFNDTAAADPLVQDILRRLLKVESILSTLLGQAYDSSGTERSRPTFSVVWRSWRRLQIRPPV